jgi:hypothetical protein
MNKRKNKLKKMVIIPDHKENAHQNHIKIPPHPLGYHQKHKQQTLARMQGKKDPHTPLVGM